MDYTEALNLMMNFNSGIRRKNWEKGKYIAYSDGREIPTIPTGDGSCAHSKWGYCTQDGKFYPTLDELLSSEGIEDFKDDGKDNFEMAEVITVYLDI